MSLPTYGTWSPTQFDAARPWDDRAGWIVGPCILTRDSGPLERANFAALEALLERADPDGREERWDSLRMGHWGPGWFEILRAAPDTPAALALEAARAALENYPVLEDDRHSRECLEDVDRTWSACYARDWPRAIARSFDGEPDALEEALDMVEPDALRSLFDVVADRAGVYWEEHSDGMSISMERVARAVTTEDLDALAGFVWPEEPIGPEGTTLTD